MSNVKVRSVRITRRHGKIGVMTGRNKLLPGEEFVLQVIGVERDGRRRVTADGEEQDVNGKKSLGKVVEELARDFADRRGINVDLDDLSVKD